MRDRLIFTSQFIFTLIVAAFLVTEMAVVVTTVYLHRGLSHRALTVSPVAARI